MLTPRSCHLHLRCPSVTSLVNSRDAWSTFTYAALLELESTGQGPLPLSLLTFCTNGSTGTLPLVTLLNWDRTTRPLHLAHDFDALDIGDLTAHLAHDFDATVTGRLHAHSSGPLVLLLTLHGMLSNWTTGPLVEDARCPDRSCILTFSLTGHWSTSSPSGDRAHFNAETSPSGKHRDLSPLAKLSERLHTKLWCSLAFAMTTPVV